jgi:hypothetical protein
MPTKAAPPASGDGLMSYADVSAQLSAAGTEISVRQIKWWVQQGWLRPTRIGQRTFIRRSELDRFLADAEGAAPGNKPAR